MLVDLIKEYYDGRKLQWPDFSDAMKFAITEVAEVFEIDLSRNPNWVRNNPQNKPKFSKEALSEELGDVIMMVMVAGIVEGVDPIEALEKKIKRKLSKLKETTIMSALGFEEEVHLTTYTAVQEALASTRLDKDKSMITQYELTDLDDAYGKE